MRRALLGLIRVYQAAVSPVLGARCRFEPTCSRYAYEAIEVHGAARGSWLAFRRLLRCRPGVPGGYDPVPDAVNTSAQPPADQSAVILSTTQSPKAQSPTTQVPATHVTATQLPTTR